MAAVTAGLGVSLGVPLGVSAAVALAAGGCSSGTGASDPGRGAAVDRSAAEGRLTARPRAEVRPDARPQAPGLRALEGGRGRAGLLYVPAGYSPDRAAPLVVLLHGAGADARAGLAPLLHLADEAGTVLLAPEARGRTWDAILGANGADVASVDALLRQVLDRFAIDPSRVAAGGFSDGASYALSLGLANGDLFTHLIAFSPGFVPRAARHGRPEIYVSHGLGDPVLPVERCSRRIVPSLRRAGYEVRYREFDAGHAVPPDVAQEAVGWLLGGPESRRG